VHDVIIFVRDQDRSLRFCLDQLGFKLVVDHRIENSVRWIEVAPPDGSANLALVAPQPDTEAWKLIGGDRWVFFLTEDVDAKFKEWSERGVRFQFPPENAAWGGVFTRFEDPDGNSFGLGRIRRGEAKSGSAPPGARGESRSRTPRCPGVGNCKASTIPAVSRFGATAVFCRR
jgi:catechol 2,3-dioxygenase-like lactoylglutathione lyase family enzyme